MKAIFIPMTILVLAGGQALAQAGDARNPAMPMQTPTQMQGQMPMHDQNQMQNQMPVQNQMQKQMPMGQMAPATDGEVRKIDKGAGKITLRHGPITNLDMPPMTMVFHVKDRAFLDKVKVGEKVRFVAEQNAGALTVTAIESAK